MIVQIKRIIYLSFLFCLSGNSVFSQNYSSINNYTGNWESPESWNPTWPVPLTDISGHTITINGYITSYQSLSFSGSANNLIVNDTLVIKGDLTLGNNNDLKISDNGILIVRGNLNFGNQSNVTVNGYLIITGNINKESSTNQGSFKSNNNPVKLFIGGTISLVGITTDPDYPVLNCLAPATIPYTNSNCSYGNMTDLANDPVYSFFQTTCIIPTPTVTAAGPIAFCDGGSVNLTSSAGTSFLWSNAATTPGINVSETGSFSVQVTNADGCKSAKSAVTIVTVNSVPVTPTITADGPITFCAGGNVTLTSSKGTGYLWSNAETTSRIIITGTGKYSVQITDANGCQSAVSAAIQITVNTLPVVNITSSSSSMCRNDSRTLTGSPAGGIFVILDGPGTINGNTLSPNGSGIIQVEYYYTDICANTATQSVVVDENPVANAGPDQELKFISETEMRAELSSAETGEWSVLYGTGLFDDIHSPVSGVTELSFGENIFLWKVLKSNCEDTTTVKIIVYDPFIPSVITPNYDGKNDYFVIGEFIDQIEIIIFNRWGIEEYSNSNYLNDWDGRNNKGRELPNDTYFYVLKFGNIKIKKGSVLINR